jgi:hypothetical protein
VLPPPALALHFSCELHAFTSRSLQRVSSRNPLGILATTCVHRNIKQKGTGRENGAKRGTRR